MLALLKIISENYVLGTSCIDYGEEWPNETITIITAKVWYVSDFNATIPPWKIINNLGKKVTPQQRAEVVLENNIDYLNVALGNSQIPIRVRAWGSVQDIGLKNSEIIDTSDKVIQRLLPFNFKYFIEEKTYNDIINIMIPLFIE